MPRGTQVKRDELVITEERRGVSSWIALRHLSCPRLHVLSAKDHTVEETALQGVGPGVGLSGQSGLKVLVGTHISPCPSNTWGNLGINNCEGPISRFSLDMGATFFVLTETPGLLSFWPTTIMGLSGQTTCYSFSHSLSCSWDSVIFSRVSNSARVSLIPSGEGYTEQGPGLCIHAYGTHSF